MLASGCDHKTRGSRKLLSSRWRIQRSAPLENTAALQDSLHGIISFQILSLPKPCLIQGLSSKLQAFLNWQLATLCFDILEGLPGHIEKIYLLINLKKEGEGNPKQTEVLHILQDTGKWKAKKSVLGWRKSLLSASEFIEVEVLVAGWDSKLSLCPSAISHRFQA